jgi:nucleotide-binding universal stress UspA family protein
MKKILVPTDFSSAAKNAIAYAAHLAVRSKAQLVLFNAYHSAPLSIDIPVADMSIDEVRMQSMAELLTIQHELVIEYGERLVIECHNRRGLALDEINDYAIENGIDMIVMGMQGSNFISEKVVGSTTTALMQDAPCPILVVDRHVKFQEIQKIVLACDYIRIPSFEALDRLKNICDLFVTPWVYVLHVISNPSVEQSLLENINAPKMHQLLRNMPHSIQSIDNPDIMDGINGFASKNHADMLVMIPRRHSIWRGIFYSPLTKKMAFHTSIPLLILQ